MNVYVIASHGRVVGIDHHSDPTGEMANLDADGLIARRLQNGLADIGRISNDESH